jgi:hypothetical protein
MKRWRLGGQFVFDDRGPGLREIHLPTDRSGRRENLKLKVINRSAAANVVVAELNAKAALSVLAAADNKS